MKIAQVSPLYESVPPQRYGGTERVVSYLTEELVRLGHRVTLFASGDSHTNAELVPVCARALRANNSVDALAMHLLMLEKVFACVSEFDLVHYHIDYLHFPLSRRYAVPHVTTLHGRLDIPELAPLYEEYADMPVISISDAQSRLLPHANWQGTVHHGIPLDLYPLSEQSGDYLAFVGRISPEKGADRAIEIARAFGMTLRIAAKVDSKDEKYFREVIRPLIDGRRIELVGEINDHEKREFLGRAYAMLFPIEWEEPFGLAMIEAMACGTPVVAFGRGSVPEVVEPGITGFVVRDVHEAVQALAEVGGLDRAACRASFERRFSARRMALDYVSVYRRLTRAWAESAALAERAS